MSCLLISRGGLGLLPRPTRLEPKNMKPGAPSGSGLVWHFILSARMPCGKHSWKLGLLPQPRAAKHSPYGHHGDHIPALAHPRLSLHIPQKPLSPSASGAPNRELPTFQGTHCLLQTCSRPPVLRRHHPHPPYLSCKLRSTHHPSFLLRCSTANLCTPPPPGTVLSSPRGACVHGIGSVAVTTHCVPMTPR